MEGAGAGKTKQLIDLVNEAVNTEHGNVVCIERKPELTFNVHHDIRLVAATEYDVASVEGFKGFISGMYAGNYDITHIFVDNLCKIVNNFDAVEIERFLNWLDVFGTRNSLKCTVTISERPGLDTEGIRKFC
jgi:hypothetical protein